MPPWVSGVVVTARSLSRECALHGLRSHPPGDSVTGQSRSCQGTRVTSAPVSTPTGPFIPAGSSELRGRLGECNLLAALVDAVRGGESRALVVLGEPGMGKTALLDYMGESRRRAAP